MTGAVCDPGVGRRLQREKKLSLALLGVTTGSRTADLTVNSQPRPPVLYYCTHHTPHTTPPHTTPRITIL